jgi:hypoxanthine phosphoribosyltransferase
MTERPLDESKIIRYSWEQMDQLHRKVARDIVKAEYHPEVIVGVSRCGDVSAVHLSYILGVRKVTSISVKSTVSDDPLAERTEAEVVLYAPTDFFRNQRLLLVDAVMESGTTVALCLQELWKRQPALIKIAMIVDWYTSSYKIASGERPKIDFMGDRATDWPDFPWEH